jgi:hypothetical protein
MYLIMEFISIVLVVALLAAFVILWANKVRLIQWVQVHGNDLFAEMFSCQFCLSFWIAAIISVALSLFFKDYRFLAIPFLSTPITRKML